MPSAYRLDKSSGCAFNKTSNSRRALSYCFCSIKIRAKASLTSRAFGWAARKEVRNFAASFLSCITCANVNAPNSESGLIFNAVRASARARTLSLLENAPCANARCASSVDLYGNIKSSSIEKAAPLSLARASMRCIWNIIKPRTCGLALFRRCAKIGRALSRLSLNTMNPRKYCAASSECGAKSRHSRIADSASPLCLALSAISAARRARRGSRVCWAAVSVVMYAGCHWPR